MTMKQQMYRITALLLPLCLSTLSYAASPMPGEKERTSQDMITDAVAQPLSDVNLKHKRLPQNLIAIGDRPYAMDGMQSCRRIIAAIRDLDTVLGPDLDQVDLGAKARARKEGAASLAGGLIASLIPFRFLIREVSGANAADRDYQAAVYAGVVRRSFLKGLGQQRRCRAPGRPATDLERAQSAAAKIMAPKDD
jgi:hypothetical protein